MEGIVLAGGRGMRLYPLPRDPERHGGIELDDGGDAIPIEEKPARPRKCEYRVR